MNDTEWKVLTDPIVKGLNEKDDLITEWEVKREAFDDRLDLTWFYGMNPDLIGAATVTISVPTSRLDAEDDPAIMTSAILLHASQHVFSILINDGIDRETRLT